MKGDQIPTESFRSPSEELDQVQNTMLSFSPDVMVFPIIRREDYSQKEFDSCWYTPKERKSLMKKHNKTVDRIELGKKPKKSDPYRGLEKVAVDGFNEMNTIRIACIDAVIDEQERQWKDGIIWLDADQIAEAAGEFSEISASLALIQGKADEEDAMEVCKSNDSELDSFNTPSSQDSVESLSTSSTSTSQTQTSSSSSPTSPMSPLSTKAKNRTRDSIQLKKKNKPSPSRRKSRRMDPPGEKLIETKRISYVTTIAPYYTPVTA